MRGLHFELIEVWRL